MNHKTPLACDLNAIDENDRADHKQNGEFVFKAVRDVQERSDGYAFKLPAETTLIEKVGAFISRERLCCPFVHFSLEISPGQGPVWLYLKGDENIKRFIGQNIVAQLMPNRE